MISQSSKDKQQEILNAALRLFVEQGFHATPTSSIAREAGVANGTLFHYYKTKDELIVALYVSIKSGLTACLTQDSLKDESPTKEDWKRYYLVALNWGLDNPLEFRFVQQFMSSPYLLLLAPEEIREQSKFMEKLIAQGIKDKLIKPLNPQLIGTLLASHIYGVSQYISNAALSEKEKKKTMDASFDMIWQMLTQ